ncbi:histidine phosphatase family protein [Pseudoalteromonas luteoviolacea]|uniref:histidine phosphatase family protein n=1 Tax=Pseudoalteromonas luteoviolacea TaxID=43657 RepID=UPI001B363C79|nr:histidine phosphatase family protein [Pseudoalteromonas luteoviolacea]MBQ4839191.1 histidine phosphatase family protein [Pseudoalteromonas luteoviolacea]
MIQTLYFIRHTETTQSGMLLGKTDSPLTSTSHQQLLTIFDSLPKPDRVISSPKLRCLAPAQAYAEKSGLALSIKSELQEMDFGLWDGKSYDWLWQNATDPSIGEFWQNPWDIAVPEGESMITFNNRIASWWQTFTADRTDDTVLVVTHGGVIKQLLALWLELPKGVSSHLNCFEVGYGCVVKVTVFYDEVGKAWPKVVF